MTFPFDVVLRNFCLWHHVEGSVLFPVGKVLVGLASVGGRQQQPILGFPKCFNGSFRLQKRWVSKEILPSTQLTSIFEGKKKTPKTRPFFQSKQGAPFGFSLSLSLYIYMSWSITSGRSLTTYRSETARKNLQKAVETTYASLKLTAKAPENRPGPKRKRESIPTIHFQVSC